MPAWPSQPNVTLAFCVPSDSSVYPPNDVPPALPVRVDQFVFASDGTNDAGIV